MKSGAIRGEQVFQVCHVRVTTIAILFNNYDYNALSRELSGFKTWSGPVSASQLPLFSEYALLLTLTFAS